MKIKFCLLQPKKKGNDERSHRSNREANFLSQTEWDDRGLGVHSARCVLAAVASHAHSHYTAMVLGGMPDANVIAASHDGTHNGGRYTLHSAGEKPLASLRNRSKVAMAMYVQVQPSVPEIDFTAETPPTTPEPGVMYIVNA